MDIIKGSHELKESYYFYLGTFLIFLAYTIFTFREGNILPSIKVILFGVLIAGVITLPIILLKNNVLKMIAGIVIIIAFTYMLPPPTPNWDFSVLAWGTISLISYLVLSGLDNKKTKKISLILLGLGIILNILIPLSEIII